MLTLVLSIKINTINNPETGKAMLKWFDYSVRQRPQLLIKESINNKLYIVRDYRERSRITSRMTDYSLTSKMLWEY